MTIPTPSAEPEDDVIELVAKVIDPDAFKPRGFSGDSDWHPDDQRLAQSRARETARAALSASGLLEANAIVNEMARQRAVELHEALERERVLRGAAEPFAEAAGEWDTEDAKDPPVGDEQAVWPTFTVGDFRRLRTALSNPLKTETKA